MSEADYDELFEMFVLDEERESEDVMFCLSILRADRQRMGTLATDPITEVDWWYAGLMALMVRFKSGMELTERQRGALFKVLMLGMDKTLEGLTAAHARREASRRGGRAGRTANPEEVMETWQSNLERCNGKKTRADAETAKELSISPSTVRKIRSAQTARK
ncbi:hypothetical protein AAG594_08765 [Citromicrobium bathyomarinum]